MRGLIGALLLALALAACGAPTPPQPKQNAQPAMWEVTGKLGERAWLFGTIHALPYPVEWRSEKVDRALAAADELVLEIAAIDDQDALEETFARLARAPNQPPLLDRVNPEQRPRLAALLREHNVDSAQFAVVETWASALLLAQQLVGEDEPKFSIDRDVLAAAKGKRIGELEGAARQLGIFDRLPERDQRDLLAATIDEALAPEVEETRLALAWQRGDMAVIEAETRGGLLADPELHEALLVRRNRDWAAQLARRLNGGGRPFVAVGAAHLAGPEGLPELLKAMGYTVTRVQ